MNRASFRFYEELNDFLSPPKRKKSFDYEFWGRPALKDAIEALGVPHEEVEVILLNGVSVGFKQGLQNGDRVAVYPVFESLDVSPLLKLRPKPLRHTAFVLDVHLGRLARLLRLLGFDTLYRNDYQDEELVAISVGQRRILLSRDKPLLFNSRLTHATWLRSTQPKEQAREVLGRFDLRGQANPFSRCLECNGLLAEVEKAAIQHRLDAKAANYFESFWVCSDCPKIYWRGSHFAKLQAVVDQLLSNS